MYSKSRLKSLKSKKWLTDEVYTALRVYGLEDTEIDGLTPQAAQNITGLDVDGALVAEEQVEEKTEGGTLQERMTKKLPTIASPNAKKAGHAKKELAKTKIATQFIGEGAVGSSTERYKVMYDQEGVSNTGNCLISNVDTVTTAFVVAPETASKLFN